MKLGNKGLRHSGYAAIMMVGVIIAVLLINYLVTSLDERYDLSADMTSNRLYSLTGTTKDVIDIVKEDIFIYTTETAGIEDANTAELLKNYAAYSDYIHVINIDIVKNPASIKYYNEFSKYSVTAGNIIVSNSSDTNSKEQRYRVLDYSDLYIYNEQSDTYDDYAAEGSITRAIKYIVNPIDQKIWLLDNHSQDNFKNKAIENTLKNENYTVKYLDILNGESQLESTDIVIIIDIENDITPIESDVLNGFLDNGGRMIIGIDAAVNAATDFANILSLIQRYNISLGNGRVIETDLNNIAVTSDDEYMYSFIIPILAEHEITNDFILGNYKLLLGMNAGYINLPDKINNADISVSPLLYTSESSFIEPWNSNMDNAPDADAKNGEFVVMTAVIEQHSEDNISDTKLVILSAPEMFAYADGFSQSVYRNKDFLIKTIFWLADDEGGIIISSKSLVDSPLMVETMNQAYMIIVIVCVVIPFLIFAAGIIIFIKRNKL